MQHGILVVDDEADIVDSLERQFRKTYRVFKATSGIEALRILQQEKITILISDQRMPEMSGVQLLERAQKIQPDCIRMLLTGYTDIESVIAAINKGQIYRYITKPWDPTDLDIIVQKAAETYELRYELKEKNKKLEEMLQELKSLDVAKSHFMLLIGHELKTPLTTVRSFLDLLKEEALPADAQKYINRIEQGADRLQEIIFDILDLLGATTGQMPVRKQEALLGPLVERTLMELKPLCDKKSISTKIEDKKIKASIDEGIFLKSVKKLLHNAIKFSPDGAEVSIQIQSESNKPQLVISNTGDPIPADRLAAVFKPFEMNENIMHHSVGMGLGLSVAAALLKHAGHAIQIQSNPAKTQVSIQFD